MTEGLVAIVARGVTPCSICGAVVKPEDEIVATSHFASSPFDPFRRYSDVPFHRRCFEAWPRRRDFIGHYNALASRQPRPDGQLFRMDGEGAIALGPPPATSPAPLPDIGLRLEVSPRRPGVFLVFSPHEDLMPARLIIAMSRAHGAAARKMRVWPIARLKASQATEEHAADIRELRGMPPGFERSEGSPDPDSLYVELGGGTGEMAMRAGACFIVRFPAEDAPPEIGCWACPG